MRKQKNTQKYILAIDQGTTSSRACLFDLHGSLLYQHSVEFEQIYPRPGWVEHSPEGILNSVQVAIEGVLKKSKSSGKEILCIGITNQRETVTLWDQLTGKAVYNSIVWQCRRTSELCEKLKKKKQSSRLIKKTGLVLDPYFSATKINWILKNSEEAKKSLKNKTLKAGTIDTFLLWHLTGGESHRTDVSNASRTLLMNIESLIWDSELLKFFSVPLDILPEIVSSSSHFGTTKGLRYLPDGIPITGMIGDQQSALFGQTCYTAGEAKCTFGTGSFILMNTAQKLVRSRHRLLTTVAWKLENRKIVYALEGGAYICGAAVQWLRDGLQIIQSSSEVESLASSVTSSEGVEFVPALTGLGAPYWDSEARGVITGLTRGTTKAHIARATLEAMALQNAEILKAMESDLRKKIKTIKVDGGATKNKLLLQLQADYLNCEVVQPEILETTALGAAYMAGLGVGHWTSVEQIAKIWKVNQKYRSKMTVQQRTLRLKSWKRAVQKSLGS